MQQRKSDANIRGSEVDVSFPAAGTPAAPVARGAEATRNRILEIATELIYANGIRGTSADRIIEQVGITKVTFYRHFRTKTDLVVAYLERQATMERGMITHACDSLDPLSALQNIAGNIGAASCLPGFRGCPFINAAAETPDPDDPVRVVVNSHRAWTRDMFARIAAGTGVTDPERTAGQLMMLRDGAMVTGYLGNPDEVAATLQQACLTIIASGQPPAA